jgi:hypothetical protein
MKRRVVVPPTKGNAAEAAATYERAVTQFIDGAGTQIAHRAFGRGEPLILLQGCREAWMIGIVALSTGSGVSLCHRL